MAKKSKTQIRKEAAARTRAWRARKLAAMRSGRTKTRTPNKSNPPRELHVSVFNASTRARLQDTTPLTRAEAIAVLSVRARAAFDTFTSNPSAAHYGALNTVLLAYQIEKAKASP